MASQTRRTAKERAMRTPSAMHEQGQRAFQACQRQQSREENVTADHQSDHCRHANASRELAGVPPQAAEIENAEYHSGGEMQCGAEDQRPGRQIVERKKTHALFIHFQADQHPSASPSIRSGAVQNSPELNVRSSQRPTKMPAQHRHDNDPAEHANLGETARHRRIAVA